MKKIMLNIVLLTMAGVSVSFGAFSGDDAGTSTAQFLKLGAGARAAGMGEAFTGVADDSTAIYWNPAGLNKLTDRSLSFMHAVWFEDISYDWFSYAQPLNNMDAIGIGIQYLSYGSISEMDSTGLQGGSFSPADLAVSLSYARHIGKTDLGLNAKYISSQIKESATAFAFDCGAMYPVSSRLTAGFSLQNVGTKMKFVSEEDALPLNIKLGGSYLLNPSWIVALDAIAPIDNDAYFAAGTEYSRTISSSVSAAGRFGYNMRNKDTGGLNGLTAGLGITYLTYTLDYAFVPYGDLGNTHRISFKVDF